MGEKGHLFLAGTAEPLGELCDDGVAFVPADDGLAAEPLNDPKYFMSSFSTTAQIEGVDEDLMRRLSGWTVLVVGFAESRYKIYSRVYTWDFEKMRRDGSSTVVVRPPSLILPVDMTSTERVISAWLNIDEAPGRDFAYVLEDEPDVLHVMSALDEPCGIGLHWMEHDL